MKTRSKFPLILYSLITFIFISFPVAAAEAPSAERATDFGSTRQDQGKPEKAKALSPRELDALDTRLAEALLLYYDGRFGEALPIFNEIASKVETMDLMWWIGTSAMNSGNLNLAIGKFQQMLAVDPKLHRVRLELAAVYFQLGKYKEARQELETVKASQPPPEVTANIDKLMAAIDTATRKLRWSVRASFGVQWDDNVSAGPDSRLVNVNGGTLTLSQSSAKQGDTGYVTNLGGNILYSFGRKATRSGLEYGPELLQHSLQQIFPVQLRHARCDDRSLVGRA